jgi:REP element-mobilizing transposase RayT
MRPYASNYKRRNSLRLARWNYTNSAYYFVTLYIDNTNIIPCLIRDGVAQLTPAGYIMKRCWRDLTHHYRNCRVDAFIIMPTHVHGIIQLRSADDRDQAHEPQVRAGFKPAPTPNRKIHSLSEIIRGFKTFSARRINTYFNQTGTKIWQRNYYDHIIRHDASLDRIRHYIEANPANWKHE